VIGHEHRDVGGWLRPAVFGVVDGLVSNFALIAGVAAASTTAKPVVAGWCTPG
jgi:VIT1/CCC1 family predicted Fe2+/Mn2+ transporter